MSVRVESLIPDRELPSQVLSFQISLPESIRGPLRPWHGISARSHPRTERTVRAADGQGVALGRVGRPTGDGNDGGDGNGLGGRTQGRSPCGPGPRERKALGQRADADGASAPGGRECEKVRRDAFSTYLSFLRWMRAMVKKHRANFMKAEEDGSRRPRAEIFIERACILLKGASPGACDDDPVGTVHIVEVGHSRHRPAAAEAHRVRARATLGSDDPHGRGTRDEHPADPPARG